MDLIEFVVEVVLISVSGVIYPGPLFFTNLIYVGRQGYKAGLKISSGHELIEIALVLLLSISLSWLPLLVIIIGSGVLKIINIIGGIAILVFVWIEVKDILSKHRFKAFKDLPSSKIYTLQKVR
jgi:threonine/homoserine/homoserine lactone efflux protein